MIIKMRGSSNRGWSPYVLYGTKRKPRDPDKVKVLKGDLERGDRIMNLTNYKENSYQIVISFKGKVRETVVRSVIDEFEQYFMMGFEEDEYHFDAVMHTDTDDDHVHIRIPKMNLLTQTQLQLYFDQKDRNRINAIRDYLDEKYKLESPLTNKPMIREDWISHINNWRRESGKKLLNFGSKKERFKIERLLTESILEMHQAELIDNFDEVKTFMEEQGVSIIKVGYDKPQDFHYLTIENELGKMRIKGEIYNEKFWENSREDREKQIDTNRKNSPNRARGRGGLEDLRAKLDNYNRKRKREINTQYNPARQRAQKRAEERKRENLERGQTIRKERSPLFAPEPYSIGSIDSSYKFYPVPVSRKRVGNTRDVSSRTKRKQIRSDSQGRFARDKGWQGSLFYTKGEALNEQVIGRCFARIREMRTGSREREEQVYSHIRTAEQELLADIEESRAVVEADLGNYTRRVDAEAINADPKDRSFASTVRDLVEKVSGRVTKLAKSIRGVRDEIMKIKLFDKAKKQVLSRRRPMIKLTPRN